MRELLLSLVAMVGAAVAVLPALGAGSSPPTTASFTAIDNKWEVSGSTATRVTIAQGGTVTFSYPSGVSIHNADFSHGPEPSSCIQTSGPNSGPVPPLPNQPTVRGWSGSCTFNTPGTYTFFCDVHRFMTGTIVVQAPGTTTSSSTTTPSGPPRPAPATFVVAARQRGTVVRATMKISAAGAGGRLVANLFATRAALGLHPRRGATRVGQLSRSSLQSRTVRLSIPLDAVAIHALRKHRRLQLTLKITVRSLQGARASAARKVLLRVR